MNVAIVGSKNYFRQSWIERFVTELPTTTQLMVTGMKGPSLWAEEQARISGMPRPRVFHIPRGDHEREEFIKYSLDRNTALVEASDIVVCFTDGTCANTKEVIRLATIAGKYVAIFPPNMSELTAYPLMTQLLNNIDIPGFFAGTNAMAGVIVKRGDYSDAST